MNRFKDSVADRLRSVRRRLLGRKAPASPRHLSPESLRPKARIKLKAMAQILSCSEDEAIRIVFERALAGTPNHPYPFYLLPRLSIARCERVAEDLVRIELDNGRTFLGQRSGQKEYLLHQVFAKHLPDSVDGDAYKLALDIERRYFGAPLPWYLPDGGVYVEGGCYTGMRAIRWHERARRPIRILAVEIGRTNFELLEANILANDLSDVITPVHAGLWSENGLGQQTHSFSTRRFLEVTDRWKGHMRHTEPVRLLTLDGLLDENGVDVASFLNLQVNGAEIEVLKALDGHIDRFKVISVAAYYSRDGARHADIVEDMLTRLGCVVIDRAAPGRITAVTPRYRDEIEQLRPRGQRQDPNETPECPERPEF